MNLLGYAHCVEIDDKVIIKLELENALNFKMLNHSKSINHYLTFHLPIHRKQRIQLSRFTVLPKSFSTTSRKS